MTNHIQVSESVIKKTMIALAHDIAGVAEVKQVSYIEEAGEFVLKLSVNLEREATIPTCALDLQKHIRTQFQELLNLKIKEVNISILSLL